MIDKQEGKKLDTGTLFFVRTLLLGVVINFIILVLDASGKGNNPYPFFLILSLIIGGVIASAWRYFDEERNRKQ